MFCRVCGKEINDQAVVCVHCGCSTQNTATIDADAPNTGIAVLSGFIPLAGLIIWLLNKDKKPLMAKSASTGALVGVGIAFAVYVLAVLMSIAAGI